MAQTIEIFCLVSSVVLFKFAQKYIPIQKPIQKPIVKKKKNKPNKVDNFLISSKLTLQEKRRQKRELEKSSLENVLENDPALESFKKILRNKTEVLNNLVLQGKIK
jgi:hypothetical protein